VALPNPSIECHQAANLSHRTRTQGCISARRFIAKSRGLVSTVGYGGETLGNARKHSGSANWEILESRANCCSWDGDYYDNRLAYIYRSRVFPVQRLRSPLSWPIHGRSVCHVLTDHSSNQELRPRNFRNKPQGWRHFWVSLVDYFVGLSGRGIYFCFE